MQPYTHGFYPEPDYTNQGQSVQQTTEVSNVPLVVVPGPGNTVTIDATVFAQMLNSLAQAKQSTQPSAQSLKLPNGDNYEGSVDNIGKPSGKGKLIYASHPRYKRYEGEFNNGVPHGIGKMIWNGGKVYDGEFANGAIEGRGIMKLRDGETLEGMFSAEEITEGICKYPDGIVKCSGIFRNSQLYYGKMRVNGYDCEGIFQDGKLWTGHQYHNVEGTLISSTYVEGKLRNPLWSVSFEDGKVIVKKQKIPCTVV